MRRMFLILVCTLVTVSVSRAQQLFPQIGKDSSEQAEYMVQLNEAVIVANQVFANDTDRYHFNQLKHYVKIVMPYVNNAVSLFNDIKNRTAGMNRRDRKSYIKSREREIKTGFEDKLSGLNITQGRLLVKLINRQLNTNCFDIVKELKNPVSAAYYQTWAKLNGINLNEAYNPEEERSLERVMRSLGY